MDRVTALWSRSGWRSSRIPRHKKVKQFAEVQYTLSWGQQQGNSQTLFLCWLELLECEHVHSDEFANLISDKKWLHALHVCNLSWSRQLMPPFQKKVSCHHCHSLVHSRLLHWVEPRVSLTAIVPQYLLPVSAVPLLQLWGKWVEPIFIYFLYYGHCHGYCRHLKSYGV